MYDATKERGSMGWRLMSNTEADFMSLPRNSIQLMGDSKNVYRGNLNMYPSNANYLTYFPYSGIYQLEEENNLHL